MAKKKKTRSWEEYDSFERDMIFEACVERLCHQITAVYHKDPDVYIQVEVALTDEKAIERGWPNAEIMRKGVNRALEHLPKDIVDGVVLQEV